MWNQSFRLRNILNFKHVKTCGRFEYVSQTFTLSDVVVILLCFSFVTVLFGFQKLSSNQTDFYCFCVKIV